MGHFSLMERGNYKKGQRHKGTEEGNRQ